MRDRTWLHAIVCFAGMCSFLGLLCFAVHKGLQCSIADSAAILSTCLCFPLLGAYAYRWLHGAAISGPLIIDCGRHPSRRGTLAAAALSFVLGLTASLLGVIDSPDDWRRWLGIVFFVTFPTLGAVQALGRLQIRENGLWAYSCLLRWERLDSYHWHRRNECVLVLRSKCRLPCFNQWAVSVAPADKAAIDEYLRKYFARKDVTDRCESAKSRPHAGAPSNDRDKPLSPETLRACDIRDGIRAVLFFHPIGYSDDNSFYPSYDQENTFHPDSSAEGPYLFGQYDRRRRSSAIDNAMAILRRHYLFREVPAVEAIAANMLMIEPVGQSGVEVSLEYRDVSREVQYGLTMGMSFVGLFVPQCSSNWDEYVRTLGDAPQLFRPYLLAVLRAEGERGDKMREHFDYCEVFSEFIRRDVDSEVRDALLEQVSDRRLTEVSRDEQIRFAGVIESIGQTPVPTRSGGLSAEDLRFIERFAEAIIFANGEEQLRLLDQIYGERPLWGLTAYCFLVSPYFADAVRESALRRVYQLDPVAGLEMAKLLKLSAQGHLRVAAEAIVAS